MNEIDELFRDYLAGIPGPGAGAAEQIAHQVVTAPKRDVPLRPRKWPRRTASIVGGLGAAGLAIVLALLLVQAPNRIASPAAARVDWGMNITVRVVPRTGTSLDDAVGQAMRALADRGRVHDVAGLAIEKVEADELRLTLPAATSASQANVLTLFNPLAIYDLRRAIVAKTIDDVAVATQRLGGPGGGYLVLQETNPINGVPNYAADQADVDRQLKMYNSPTLRIPPEVPRYGATPIPDHVRVIGDVKAGEGLAFVRDDPIVRPADIDEIHVDGTRVVLTLDAAAATRASTVARERQQATTTSGTGLVAVQAFQGRVDLKVGAMTISGRTAVIETGNAALAQPFADAAGNPPVEATLELVSSEPYGARPSLDGEHVARLPAEIEQSRRHISDPRSPENIFVEVRREAIVKILTVPFNDRQLDVYAGRTPAGDDIVWFPRLGGPNCQPDLGAPVLQSCGAMSTRQLGTSHVDTVYFGRVNGKGIASVDIETPAGATYHGVVGNGWFVAVAGNDVERSVRTQILARDRTGHEIARVGVGMQFGIVVLATSAG